MSTATAPDGSIAVFLGEIEAFNQSLLNAVDQVRREAFANFAEEVIDRTPVDTGAAANSWVVGIGEPARSPVPPILDPSRATGKANMRAAIDALPPLHPGDLALSSDLPYMQRLEEGWSQQAPTGMVRLAALRWQSHVDAAAERAASDPLGRLF
jgi:hypothetical protein